MQNNTTYAKLILNLFEKKNVQKFFFKKLHIIIQSYPTKYNKNKFIVGAAIEKLFIETILKYSRNIDIKLCSENEQRNDVTIENKYKYSLKYSSLNINGNFTDVRLINKRTNKKDKDYEIDEDIFLICSANSMTTDKIIDPKTNRFVSKKNEKKYNKILEENSLEFLQEKLYDKYSSRIIYIPKEFISKDNIVNTQDGINLKANFIENFYKNNKNYVINYINKDINNKKIEVDIIKIAMEYVLDYKFKYV